MFLNEVHSNRIFSECCVFLAWKTDCGAQGSGRIGSPTGLVVGMFRWLQIDLPAVALRAGKRSSSPGRLPPSFAPDNRFAPVRHEPEGGPVADGPLLPATAGPAGISSPFRSTGPVPACSQHPKHRGPAPFREVRLLHLFYRRFP